MQTNAGARLKIHFCVHYTIFLYMIFTFKLTVAHSTKENILKMDYQIKFFFLSVHFFHVCEIYKNFKFSEFNVLCTFTDVG